MHIPALGLLAMVLAGQVASMARFASDRWWFSPGLASRAAVSVAVLASLAWLVPTAWVGFREAWLLAQAQREAGVSHRLIQSLERAAVLAPGNPRTALLLGDNLRRASFFAGSEWTSRRPEAIAWLGRAAAINPHDPAPHMALAEAWAWAQELDKAVAASAKARAMAPRLVAAANLHGWVLFQRAQYREAREQFQQSLEWDPWTNHYARAYLEACDAALGVSPPPGQP
jgi:tetratricopeptide (TPR) repeat protein